jgi:hypothetical protein
MKYILILLVLIGCSKPKTSNVELLENKKWYVYKEVTPAETFNMAEQYWFEAKSGRFIDYDKYEGTYQIKKDTFRIYFFNYGYETYFIDKIDKQNLTLKKIDSKGTVYRKLFFRAK